MIQKQINIIPYQLFFLLIQVQIGVSVVTLPHDVFLISKGDGWISVILTGIIMQIVIIVYIQLMSRFPSYTLAEVLEALLGKFFSKVIIILYVLYFLFLASLTFAKYALLLSAWMMPRTPSWVLLLLMGIIVFYVASSNLEKIAQFFVLTSFILLIYIGFSIYALKEANVTFILPIGASGANNILAGVTNVFSSFAGIELLLLIYPYIHTEKRKIIKIATISNVFLTVFNTFIVLTSLLYLSPEELKIIPEPVLYVVKSFTFKIIERPDLIFTSIWIILVATTLTMLIYISKHFIHFMYPKGKNMVTVTLLLVVSYIIAIPTRKVYTLQTVSQVVPYIVTLFMIVLPILFYLIAIIFSKRPAINSEGEK